MSDMYDFFGDNDDDRDDDFMHRGDSPGDDVDFPGDFGGDFKAEEPEMMAEIGAYERAGTSGRLNMTLIQGGTLGELQKKAMKELATPEDRFQLYVDAISRKLNGDNIMNVSQTEIDAMLDAMPMVPNIQYKNPTAYILGFLATAGGRKISVSKIKTIIEEVLPQLPESGVEAPDVVRYARLWMNVK